MESLSCLRCFWYGLHIILLVDNIKNVFLKADASKSESAEARKYPEGFLLGSLHYLSTHKGTDIPSSVGVLSKFREIPSTEHWMPAKHVFIYLRGTTSIRIVIGEVESGQRKHGSYRFTLLACRDSDWAKEIKTENSIGDTLSHLIKV